MPGLLRTRIYLEQKISFVLENIVQQSLSIAETEQAHNGAYYNKLPTLFLIWILLSVIAPHADLYKAWFHLVFALPLLVLLASRLIRWRSLDIDTRDALFWVSIGFALYGGLSSLVVSTASLAEHLDALRWSLESGLMVLLLYIVFPRLFADPLYLARFFLACTLMGSLASLAIFGLFEQFSSRLYGLGALANPVQAGAVLVVYLAIGSLLLWRQHQALTRNDLLLLLSALATTFIAVFLTESRGPILAMSLAIVYVLLIGAVTHRAWKTLLIAAGTLAVAGTVVLFYYGLDGLVESMAARGTSYRLTLWAALLENRPDSLLLGHGSATDLTTTAAGQQILEETGFETFHAHNLWIGTYAKTGLLGVLIVVAIFALVLKTIWSSAADLATKLYMLGIWSVVVLLCITDTYTLLISVRAVWLFTWLPLIFLWLWAKEENKTPRP